MKTKTLFVFLALSFGLTWGLAAIPILFYDQVVALRWRENGRFDLAT